MLSKLCGCVATKYNEKRVVVCTNIRHFFQENTNMRFDIEFATANSIHDLLRIRLNLFLYQVGHVGPTIIAIVKCIH